MPEQEREIVQFTKYRPKILKITQAAQKVPQWTPFIWFHFGSSYVIQLWFYTQLTAGPTEKSRGPHGPVVDPTTFYRVTVESYIV